MGSYFVNHQEPMSSQMAKNGMTIRTDRKTCDLSLNAKMMLVSMKMKLIPKR